MHATSATGEGDELRDELPGEIAVLLAVPLLAATQHGVTLDVETLGVCQLLCYIPEVHYLGK
jgi:hypothetical protein